MLGFTVVPILYFIYGINLLRANVVTKYGGVVYSKHRPWLISGGAIAFVLGFLGYLAAIIMRFVLKPEDKKHKIGLFASSIIFAAANFIVGLLQIIEI